MSSISSVPVQSTRRRNTILVAAAALTALALVVFMIASVTRAAWTDTTDNTGNSWDTGSVSLTDDDLGVAMFTTTNMVPGDVVENDIIVTNESTVPLDVKLYGANLVNADGLAEHLNLKIGTTLGAGDVYTGTLAAFIVAHSNYATGTPVINLGTELIDESKTYYFWVELDAATPSTLQASTAGIDFVWEGQTQ